MRTLDVDSGKSELIMIRLFKCGGRRRVQGVVSTVDDKRGGRNS